MDILRITLGHISRFQFTNIQRDREQNLLLKQLPPKMKSRNNSNFQHEDAQYPETSGYQITFPQFILSFSFIVY